MPTSQFNYLKVYYLESESEVSHVRLSATPWTVAHHAPLSMEFSRQEYWSGLLLLSLMTNLDSLLKNRAITLPKMVHLVKDMVSPIVIHGCESWKLVLIIDWKD